MAFKVSSSRLIKVAKVLQRQRDAINTLERLGSNKIVFMELKKESDDLIDELKTVYDLENFDEWTGKKTEVLNQEKTADEPKK